MATLHISGTKITLHCPVKQRVVYTYTTQWKKTLDCITVEYVTRTIVVCLPHRQN